MGVRRCCWGVVILAVLAGTGLAADVPAAVDANDAAAVKALIRDLGSPEFAMREKSQRALETVPYGQIEVLRKYAAEATEPEAKNRMGAVLDHIEEVGLMSPPAISVDFKDLTARQVTDALGKAVGAPLPAMAQNDVSQKFTLQAKNESLPEILRQLAEQHPLWPPAGTVDVPQQVQAVRGGVVLVTEPKSGAGGVTFQVTAILDPRIKFLETREPQIQFVRDDQGQSLEPSVGSDGRPAGEALAAEARARAILAARAGGGGGSSRGAISKSFSYAGEKAAGKTLSIGGKITCVLQISETSIEIADAGKHVGEAIALGDSKVTLRKISPASEPNARTGLELAIVPNDAKGDAPPAPAVKFTATGMSLNGGLSAGAGSRLVIDSEGAGGGMSIGDGSASTGSTHVTVTDATGKTVANYTIPRGLPVTSIHAVPGDFKEPLKFVFSVPNKTREVTVPFEFKNLPIK